MSMQRSGFAMLVVLGMTLSASAINYYWIGNVSSDFEEAGNWRVGSPDGAVATNPPANNDYGDIAYFTEDAVNKTVVCPSSRTQINAIRFVETTGWDLTSSGVFTMKSMSASGTGQIAVIHQAFQISNIPITVSGGTLTLDFGSFYFTGSGMIELQGTGGGTLRVTGPITGWSKDRGVKIMGDTTLRLDGSPAWSLACKHVSLAAPGAKYVYRDTVAGAEAKLGVSSSGANGIINEYDPENSQLVVRALEDDLEGYVEVSLMSAGVTALARTEDGWTVTVKNDYADSTMSVLASDGVNPDIVIPLGDGETAQGTEVSVVLDDYLLADTTYRIAYRSEQATGELTNTLGYIYTGTPTLAVPTDMDEAAMTPGVLRVSRAAASEYPLVVNYTFASEDAEPGVDFQPPSGTVTIPEGEAYVDVSVSPIPNAAIRDDQTVVFSLAAGNYDFEGAESAAMTIVNSQAEILENVWIAGPESDNLASTAANWTRGVPTADSDILVQDAFSANDLIWDLPPVVKSFVQTNYTGTVTFRTQYGDTGFTVFTVTGDCRLYSGTWTHEANSDAEVYRLAVSVGGDFLLDTAAKIDLAQKGYAVNCAPVGGTKGIHGGGRGGSRAVYGDVYEPVALGAGGDSHAGGGALHLVVAGEAKLDGKVSVISAQNSNSWGECKAGAAGSVYLRAASVSGSGSIDASAPQYNATDGGTPSGGRIAIALTEATELALPMANLTAYGTLARGTNSSGAGTILVKSANQTYGTLYVKNRTRGESGTWGIMLPDVEGVTLIPAGATWTFDGISFAEAGILAVAEGTTLRLPTGFAAIGGTSYRAGLLYLGGTIDAGDESPHVLQGGKWIFHAETPYTFARNVIVRDEAAIGTLRLYCTCSNLRRSDVTVNGDLEVAANGYLYASGAGLNHINGTSRFGGYFAYGGMPAMYGTDASKAYGSVLDPELPGAYGYWDDTAGQYTGGGAVKLTVTGTLTLNGTAISKGSVENAYTPGGTGGSINLTAGRIAGTGTIVADGSSCEQNSSKIDTVAKLEAKGARVCAGGGRIAVRLTADGATFPEGFANQTRAYGGVFSNGGAHLQDTGTNGMASAGTIYLQDATQGEGEGTVYVKNGNRSNNFFGWTPFPALNAGDELAALKHVALELSEAGRVAVGADLRMGRLTVAEGSAVHLNGKTLKVTAAKFGETKLESGVYTAADWPGFLEDADAGEGMMIVEGAGLKLILR